MGSLYLSLILSLILLAPLQSCSAKYQTLNQGSHLSPKNPSDVLLSPNATFSTGFYPVGRNAYAFAIWFSTPTCSLHHNCTVAWMANRNHPVNGTRSKLSLTETGNLMLTDASQFNVWATQTATRLAVQLHLADSGNLVLKIFEGKILWQSFDSPTDTFLPRQTLSRFTTLVSRRRNDNFSSGFYRLFFSDDNILHLLFDGHETSNAYWPSLGLLSWEAGRSTYDSTRQAMISSLGKFRSTDNLEFQSADYGPSRIQRSTLDYDGNLRLYNKEEKKKRWVVSWQVINQIIFHQKDGLFHGKLQLIFHQKDGLFYGKL